MKYLICSGDSFTDHYHRSQPHPEMDTSWPKWPELLGKKLNMKVINVGGSGQGNEYIYSTIQDAIEGIEDKNQIGMVIAGWSQCQRRDYQTALGHFDGNRGGWDADPIYKKGNIFGWVKKSLRLFKNLEYMCKYYDIPYIQFQMIPLFIDYLKRNTTHTTTAGDEYKGIYEEDYNIILKMILDYDKIIDTSKFIGWPGIGELGGFSFNYELLGRVVFQREQFKFGFTISEEDNHPNAAGQIKIAEYLYEKINR